MAARGKRRWPATAFSRFVRQRRGDLQKSQATVADALHLNQSYISQLERGRPPSRNVDFVNAYAEALEVSSDVLWDLLGVRAGNRYSASVGDLKPTVQGLARLTEDLSTHQIRLLDGIVVIFHCFYAPLVSVARHFSAVCGNMCGRTQPSGLVSTVA